MVFDVSQHRQFKTQDFPYFTKLENAKERFSIFRENMFLDLIEIDTIRTTVLEMCRIRRISKTMVSRFAEVDKYRTTSLRFNDFEQYKSQAVNVFNMSGRHELEALKIDLYLVNTKQSAHEDGAPEQSQPCNDRSPNKR
jgi:hypothetical protein